MRRARPAGLALRVATGLLLTALATASAHGQDRSTFLTVGPLGLGGADGRAGLAVHAGLGHSFGESIVSGRAAALLLGAEFLWDDLWDVSLMYGRGLRSGNSFLSVGAGVGYVGGSALGEGRHTAGLALEAQVFNRPSKRFSFGVYAFANLNGRRSFAGATMALGFGRS